MQRSAVGTGQCGRRLGVLPHGDVGEGAFLLHNLLVQNRPLLIGRHPRWQLECAVQPRNLSCPTLSPQNPPGLTQGLYLRKVVCGLLCLKIKTNKVADVELSPH